nr:MAG TPA: hypothetical protein [Caudoviricetes sp.]
MYNFLVFFCGLPHLLTLRPPPLMNILYTNSVEISI